MRRAKLSPEELAQMREELTAAWEGLPGLVGLAEILNPDELVAAHFAEFYVDESGHG